MRRTDFVRIAYGVVLGIAMLGAMAGGAVWYFGCLHNAFLYLNGQDYVVEPARFDVGSGPVGEKRTATIHVRNFTSKPIRVVGLSVSCNCVSTEPLPVVINPRQNREFRFLVYLRGNGSFEQMAILLLDNDGRMRQAPVLIIGKCIDTQGEGER